MFAHNPLVLSAVAAPFLAAGAYKLTKAELANETLIKKPRDRETDLKKYKEDQHGEYKAFGVEALEEVLDRVA